MVMLWSVLANPVFHYLHVLIMCNDPKQICLNICIFRRADMLRESTEAVFAACDAAHGRWAKLIGVRAALHPK